MYLLYASVKLIKNISFLFCIFSKEFILAFLKLVLF